YGWRLSFVVFGGLGVLLGLVLSRHLRDPDLAPARVRPDLAPVAPGCQVYGATPGGDRHPQLPHRRPGTIPSIRRPGTSLLCLLGAFMCANFVAVVLLSWMPKFLFDRFHMSLGMAGLTATAFVQLASMAGAPVGGWLAD